MPRDWGDIGLFDRVIYTAAYGNIYGQRDIYETYRVNVTEPLRLLSHALESFVYISTSSVLIPNQTPYSRSKKAMEEIIETCNFPICAARPSTVTGVGEQPYRLIPTLIRSCIDGEEMPFVPEPTHDFIDVDDFVNGVIYVSQNIDQFRNRAINISSGVTYSNAQVRKMVELATGRQANVKIVPSLRNYDTKEWYVPPTINFAEKPLYLSIQEMVNEYLGKKNS